MGKMKIHNFINCPVIIYDNDNNYITKAIVEEYNKRDKSIIVSEDLEHITQAARLKVLIIHPGGATEFNGTRMRSFKGIINKIELFNEQQRGARTAIRYQLDSPAAIRSFVVKSGQELLNPPLDVIVENISSAGVLVKSPPGHLKINHILEIHVNIQDREIVLFGKITREKANTDKTVSYGCKLIFPKKTTAA